MTVEQLIEQLQTYNPKAEILFWSSWDNEEGPTDNQGNYVTITKVIDWERESKETATECWIGVIVQS